MERTEVNVTTKISIHSLLNALVLLANVYPMERVAEYQIERIEGAARILRERMKDYEEKKNKTAPASVIITPVMPSGWTYTKAPIAVDATFGAQWVSTAPAKTVMNRRMGPITRRKHSTLGSPSRRHGKGRRKDDTVLPLVIERRVGPDSRRKVNDYAHPDRIKRIASYGPNGRRSTDRESYTLLPAINKPPQPVVDFVRGKNGQFKKKK